MPTPWGKIDNWEPGDDKELAVKYFSLTVKTVLNCSDPSPCWAVHSQRAVSNSVVRYLEVSSLSFLTHYPSSLISCGFESILPIDCKVYRICFQGSSGYDTWSHPNYSFAYPSILFFSSACYICKITTLVRSNSVYPKPKLVLLKIGEKIHETNLIFNLNFQFNFKCMSVYLIRDHKSSLCICYDMTRKVRLKSVPSHIY